MRSRWADLAEFKEADKEYEPGTLVMFGGEKEITLSRNGVANAIVTTKPGLMWYEFWKKPIAIALDSWPAGGKVNCITKMEF